MSLWCLPVFPRSGTATALLSIDCCSSPRMSATRSLPCSLRMLHPSPSDDHVRRIGGHRHEVVAHRVVGRGDTGATPEDVDVQEHELVPSRLAPCTETYAHSPAA